MSPQQSVTQLDTMVKCVCVCVCVCLLKVAADNTFRSLLEELVMPFVCRTGRVRSGVVADEDAAIQVRRRRRPLPPGGVRLRQRRHPRAPHTRRAQLQVQALPGLAEPRTDPVTWPAAAAAAAGAAENWWRTWRRCCADERRLNSARTRRRTQPTMDRRQKRKSGRRISVESWTWCCLWRNYTRTRTGDVAIECRELRSVRYLSDGFCTSVRPVHDVVCTGTCLHIRLHAPV